MAVTWTKNETFDGTRVQTTPDPDNEGETISETLTGIRDIEVTFTEDATTPNTIHTRKVNVCFAADGTYDEAATDAIIAQVALGVSHKVSVGVILNATE
jgi:hypothetical protein